MPTPVEIARGPSYREWTATKFEPRELSFDSGADLLCFSHLRWNFVWQRPQHLLSRCARERRVFYVEEPLVAERGLPELELTLDEGVCVVRPRLPREVAAEDRDGLLRELIDDLHDGCSIRDSIHWYYTPMALGFTRHLDPLLVIYDCMDELSAFRGAPPALVERERELFARAHVVFTGGRSLCEVKRDRHPNVHCFPSSIDREHFGQARFTLDVPEELVALPRPRLGYCGVIDERLDLGLLDRLAASHPDWSLVMIGPVCKLDESELPRRPNIHYFGQREYAELPRWLAGWDVGLLPFALNEATRYISPTKTPEYLAAGKPVVSTPIADVVDPYGKAGVVRIADSPAAFVAAVEGVLAEPLTPEWLASVDTMLRKSSWDRTWFQMMSLVEAGLEARGRRAAARARTAGIAAPSPR